MIAAKYVIVKCKYTQVNPEIIHYKTYLKKIECVERLIAQNKGKIALHESKWNTIL